MPIATDSTHPRRTPSQLLTLLLLCVSSLGVCALGACQKHRLIDAPYVMRSDAGRQHFQDVPEHLRTSDIPVLYVTNRAVDRHTPEGPRFGYGRSKELAYGIARVALSPEPTWDKLVNDSVTVPRDHHYHIRVASVEPVGVVKPVMDYMVVEDGRIQLARDAIVPITAAKDEFDRLFDTWLGPGGSGPAYIYVHGYNNTFDDSVFRVAESWHFAARPGLPICFSWPAGSGGLKGYAYDRESGEYSVVPLKSLIWMLVASPRVTEIHIISHSRGTDVASTALREIQYEMRGLYGRSLFAPVAGREFINEIHQNTEIYRALRLRTLVLAAPDMDLDVFIQRFFNEGLIHVADRIAIYTSREDVALSVSNWLFRGRSRLGDLKVEKLDPKGLALIDQITTLQLINCDVKGTTSHGYIFQHPAAFSDLILLLRDNQDPGPGTVRPLYRKTAGIWQLDNDYLKPRSP
ncbi:MAG: alpha/beta hydrolase [Phycisphaeraceae bacterium]|nr:alpha/beta hydrolase [Phycisphaeraceae bacterium]MBX3368242.1 alpha/beta hydrolase [Phycisphaeraceae bacterium]QYK47946.1 MAG: alpha/beta hydrolase [Phycisphaeraceae bacterium]